MANEKPALSPVQQEAVNSVTQWLKGEHDYQFRKNQLTHSGHPQNSRMHILTFEIPNKWERFQFFRDLALVDKKADPKKQLSDKLLMQVGQNVLKCAAAARGAFVWAGVSSGKSFKQANDMSWEGLDTFTTRLRTGSVKLPYMQLLGATAEDATKLYLRDEHAYGKPSATFMAMTGLAIRGLLEYQNDGPVLVLPRPGVPSGELEVWDDLPVAG